MNTTCFAVVRYPFSRPVYTSALREYHTRLHNDQPRKESLSMIFHRSFVQHKKNVMFYHTYIKHVLLRAKLRGIRVGVLFTDAWL